MPLTEICAQNYTVARERQLFKNIMYIGALSVLLEIEPGVIETLLGEQYRGKEKLLDANRKAFHLGGFVSAGQLQHADVREQLYRAAQANGHVAKHGDRQTLATIDSGLRAGAQRPRRTA